MPTLFDPIQIGELFLPNRIIMAPLTRLRGTPDHIPTPVMAKYYGQRASAGLIVSEATPVSPKGVGYAHVPGIWSDRQVEGWKAVTDAVHQAGGLIFSQIWHVGRVSHSSFLNGELPIAPSAIAPAGHVSLLQPPQDYETPRSLDISEIPGIVAEYKKGAENAKAAGFDGVEVHGANGYLLDQFLQDGSNHRTDAYGGTIEKRARLMLEVVDAVADVWTPGRIGLHLAPRRDMLSMGDSTPAETFGYVAREAGKRKIAFLMAREHEGPDWMGPTLKQQFGGVYIGNENFTKESAEAAIERGDVDAVAFGKQFISNPDLPRRFAEGAPLNELVMSTLYSTGAEGYADYPALGE